MMFTFPVVLYLFILLFALLLETTIKNRQRYQPNYKCLRGKTVIVTGGNSGLGLNTAIEMAARGAKIILACRDLMKASFAKRRIIDETHNENVVVHRMDLQSLQSVRHFCDIIIKEEERIDYLINNAGAIHLGDHQTCDGLQITWQVNYFAPFLLTNLLLGKLQKGEGRIVNVTGFFCSDQPILVDVNSYWSKKWIILSDLIAFYQAKSAFNDFSVELSRRLKNDKSHCSVSIFAPKMNSSFFWRRISLSFMAIFYLFLHIIFPTPKREAKKLVNSFLNEIPIEACENDEFLSKELWSKTCHILNI